VKHHVKLVVGILAAVAATAIAGEPVNPPPASPPVRLASIADDDREPGTARAVEERVAWLIERTDKASTPKDKVSLALASANLILARVIEPRCSRAMLGIDDDAPLSLLEASLAQAAERLTVAENLLATDTAGDDGTWRQAANRQLHVLQSFHAGLSAYFVPDADERTTRRAISGLSPLLEDGERSVAAAATFWQACLRSLDSDLSRAMSVLEPPLGDIRESDLPYAFFGHVLRCRLISRQGGHAAAIALLIQMEDRCEDWFAEEASREDAVRALRLVRCQILDAWKNQWPEGTAQDERAWIAERTARIIESSFPEEHNTVLRLLPLIPVVAPVPTDSAGSSSSSP